MSTALRILVLEDDPYDAELEIATLEEAGYSTQWERVETRAAFLWHLETYNYNLVLADYSLPAFDGLAALKLFLKRGFDQPFILVSGAVGEEIAIESLKAGATDYVLKNRLSRLGPVVQRALREKEEQRRRRQAEEQLHKLSCAVEQSPALVVITDVQGHIEYVNPKFSQITGYTFEEVVGKTPRILKSDETPSAEYKQLWETITSGGEWRGEFHNRKKNGELYWELASISSIRNAAGVITHFLAIKEDITERKQLAEQLLQAQKMEAIGQLAGGVAHDFNNLLTVIKGYAELLLARQLDDDDSLRHELEHIRKAGERASVLTRQLLTFSRKQTSKPEALNLNNIVTNVEKMLERLLGEDIHIVVVLDPTLGQVMADSGQMEQIIINLAVNARDAMPRGGRLTIKTANVQLDQAYTGQHPGLKAGPYITLTVSDTGVGIAEETQACIFEPFFTTKTPDKGTGLGLSIAYEIIRQGEGHISVFSEPGQGAAFKIYLPQIEAAAKTDEPDRSPAALSPGSETILLVEDDAGVRLVASRFLQSSGYSIIEAANGDEAIHLCQQYHSPIHLLLTDVIMPDMSGRQLAEHMETIRPDMQILYMSGHLTDTLKQYGVEEANMALIKKPFTLDSLARKVHEVLNI